MARRRNINNPLFMIDSPLAADTCETEPPDYFGGRIRATPIVHANLLAPIRYRIVIHGPNRVGAIRDIRKKRWDGQRIRRERLDGQRGQTDDAVERGIFRREKESRATMWHQ